MLMDKQEGAAEDIFKCVACGRTTPARTVEGNGPLDVEKQADDMYHHAVNVLRQQVWQLNYKKKRHACWETLAGAQQTLLSRLVACRESCQDNVLTVGSCWKLLLRLSSN